MCGQLAFSVAFALLCDVCGVCYFKLCVGVVRGERKVDALRHDNV